MADLELINGIQENFRDLRLKVKIFAARIARKVCQWPRCVHFLASNMYESLRSGMSDNKVNKESDQAKH